MEIHLPVSGNVWLSVTGQSGVTLAEQLFVKDPLSNFVKIRQFIRCYQVMDRRTDGRGLNAVRSF